MSSELTVSQEDAEAFIVRRLRTTELGGPGKYGYGIWLPDVMLAYVRERLQRPELYYSDAEVRYRPLSPIFYAAAWELCRRGILRPGVAMHGGQGIADGASGYSLTPWGETWLAKSSAEGYVPTEPVRFVELLRAFATLFGPGFLTRGSEAALCYRFGAHLACCVMCGAAAESILLALAIVRSGDEAAMLREYAAAGGRTKIERRLSGGLPDHLKEQFSTLLSVLKYWRDESGHGRPSMISDIEAYTALGFLLRAAQFGRDHYASLTGHAPPG